MNVCFHGVGKEPSTLSTNFSGAIKNESKTVEDRFWLRELRGDSPGFRTVGSTNGRESRIRVEGGLSSTQDQRELAVASLVAMMEG
jgi:hypothetical protein